MLQLLQPEHLEPVLRNERSHRNGKSALQLEKSLHSDEDPAQPKINR